MPQTIQSRFEEELGKQYNVRHTIGITRNCATLFMGSQIHRFHQRVVSSFMLDQVRTCIGVTFVGIREHNLLKMLAEKLTHMSYSFLNRV